MSIAWTGSTSHPSPSPKNEDMRGRQEKQDEVTKQPVALFEIRIPIAAGIDARQADQEEPDSDADEHHEKCAKSLRHGVVGLAGQIPVNRDFRRKRRQDQDGVDGHSGNDRESHPSTRHNAPPAVQYIL